MSSSSLTDAEFEKREAELTEKEERLKRELAHVKRAISVERICAEARQAARRGGKVGFKNRNEGQNRSVFVFRFSP